jgi:hypothetical protein
MPWAEFCLSPGKSPNRRSQVLGLYMGGYAVYREFALFNAESNETFWLECCVFVSIGLAVSDPHLRPTGMS